MHLLTLFVMFYYKTYSHKTMPSHKHNKTPSQDLHNIKLMTIHIHYLLFHFTKKTLKNEYPVQEQYVAEWCKRMMAARRRRQPVSLENRECLIRAFNDPVQDYLSVADTLGINCSTARGIVRRHL